MNRKKNMSKADVLQPAVSGKSAVSSLNVSLDEKYNRKFKDTFFTALFKDKRYAKMLYESLFPDKEPIDESDIEILNLENIFTIDLYNDACILAGDRLIVLAEHQSTVNKNMPTRLLLYVAEEYKRMFSNDRGRELYSRAIKFAI